MSFQITHIVLYGPEGVDAPRLIAFKPGRLNIITGKSATGKSQLISIVDYVLGSEKCEVADGPIRESVSWYGLRLMLRTGAMLIVRRAPVGRADSSGDVHMQIGHTGEFPSKAELRHSLNIAALRPMLTTWAGIKENQQTPIGGGQREPLSATVRHALFFCFQEQNELSNRKKLFHRQGDNSSIERDIRDVLPYFVGAVDDDNLAKRGELRRLRDEIRAIERLLAEREAVRNKGAPMAMSLLQEARDLGLLVDSGERLDQDAVVSQLRLAEAQVLGSGVIDADEADEVFERLNSERDTLSNVLRETASDLRAARKVHGQGKKARSEVQDQAVRLRSLGVFRGLTQEGDGCPVCKGPLNAGATPDEMKVVAERLANETVAIEMDVPYLDDMISKLEDQQAAIRQRLGEVDASLKATVASRERLRKYRDRIAKVAHLQGRIALYLESASPPMLQDIGALQTRLEALMLDAATIAEIVSGEAIEERVESILSQISAKVTEYARTLKLEHAKYPIRVDLRRLTLVADSPEKPVPLDRMGSGENWVGYHLAAHLALHWWFAKQQRPVPSFLFIDQPSQAYFSSGQERDRKKDEDRMAVNRMIKLLYDVAKDVQPGLQIILIEHAAEPDAWFEESIIETWRRGRRLIPSHWLEDEPTEEVEDSE